MTEEQYIKVTSYFRKNKFRENILKFLSKFTPLLIVLIYSTTLLLLFISNNYNFKPFLLVPASNFIFVSLLRKILNKPRPYDLYNYTPIVKYTKGKGTSFPSRHTSSAFVITISYFYINHLYLGIFMLFISLIIALSRILSGVHFPKDVLCASVISILWAIVGFHICI